MLCWRKDRRKNPDFVLAGDSGLSTRLSSPRTRASTVTYSRADTPVNAGRQDGEDLPGLLVEMKLRALTTVKATVAAHSFCRYVCLVFRCLGDMRMG